jgi:hypothetical protein
MVEKAAEIQHLPKLNAEAATDQREIDFGDVVGTPPTLTVTETIQLGTHRLRMWVAGATLLIFFIINGFVLYGLNRALSFDFVMLAAKTSGYDRFINTTVIASILGATTVQLGAIMFAITKFLFPARE